MVRILSLCLPVALLLIATGCGTACGPLLKVPPQKLALIARSPDNYKIRVTPDTEAAIETQIPSDGRVVFNVPVSSRDSYFVILGVRAYHYPPPDTFRVVRVLRGKQTIHKLSAKDIGKLPTDSEGYHLLKIDD